MNILEPLFALAFLLLIMFLVLPVLYDYRFSEDGIDIVCLAGLFKVWHISKNQIKDVRILKLRNIFSGNETIKITNGQSLLNRLKSKFLVIETTGTIPFWYLTPKDPEKAMSKLNI